MGVLVSASQSGEHSLGGAHAWGPSDTHARQRCLTCEVWRMTPRPHLVYYSRSPDLTATWSVIRPPCRAAAKVGA